MLICMRATADQDRHDFGEADPTVDAGASQDTFSQSTPMSERTSPSELASVLREAADRLDAVFDAALKGGPLEADGPTSGRAVGAPRDDRSPVSGPDVARQDARSADQSADQIATEVVTVTLDSPVGGHDPKTDVAGSDGECEIDRHVTAPADEEAARPFASEVNANVNVDRRLDVVRRRMKAKRATVAHVAAPERPNGRRFGLGWIERKSAVRVVRRVLGVATIVIVSAVLSIVFLER